jgi:hypothetical protein
MSTLNNNNNDFLHIMVKHSPNYIYHGGLGKICKKITLIITYWKIKIYSQEN